MSANSRPNLRRILSDTWRIIATQPRHFSALSILFLLPNYSLSAITYTFLFLQQPNSLISDYVGGKILQKSQITIPILYVVFVLLFGICADASITHSTFRGFYGKPVTLTIKSLHSIRVSFFPLLATHLATKIIEGLILFGFGISMLLAYKGISMNDKNLIYFVIFMIGAAVIAAAMIYLLIFRWYVATPVAVVEAQWGLAALERSEYLVKEMSGVVFSMILLFGVLFGISWMWYWSLVGNYVIRRNSWGYFVIMEIIVCVGFWTVLSVYSIAATTVLFIHCKSALHGGVETAAFRIDDDEDDDEDEEEFGREIYVRLPFD